MGVIAALAEVLVTVEVQSDAAADDHHQTIMKYRLPKSTTQRKLFPIALEKSQSRCSTMKTFSASLIVYLNPSKELRHF